MMEISPSCAAHLKDLEGMVLSPEEMCQVKVPSRYTDPALRDPEAMLQLTSRLYDARMIRGVDNVKAYVGALHCGEEGDREGHLAAPDPGCEAEQLLLEATPVDGAWRTFGPGMG